MRNGYKILVSKPEGKGPLIRPRHREKDNIRMVLREIGWEAVDWIHLTQDRVLWQAPVNVVMNLLVSKKVGNFLTR
jgi:hypothetical protein